MGILNALRPIDDLEKKILEEFKGVEGLEEIIQEMMDLRDSEIYKKVHEVSVKCHEEGLNRDEFCVYLLEMPQVKQNQHNEGKINLYEILLEIPQVKQASSVLKNTPFYLPPLTDVITVSSFISTIHVIIWVYCTYSQKDLSREDVLKIYTILERVMSALNNFDEIQDYEAHGEEFYKKLKQIKWDKTGKKLFNKLSDLKFQIGSKTSRSSFRIGETLALTFIAACNAVHQGKDRILKEDVVKSYKTYLKLLNTDITKLNVLYEDLDQINPESTVGPIETSDDELIKEKTPEIVKDNLQNSNINQGNFCPDCGSFNVAHAKYCAFCGSKLGL